MIKKRKSILVVGVYLCFLLGSVHLSFASDVNLVLDATSSKSFVITDSGLAATEFGASEQNVIIGSYGINWGLQTFRGIYSFNGPAVIRQNYPGYYVKSAVVTLTLQYGSCKDASGNEYQPYIMPGVSAYSIRLTNRDVNSVLATSDFWSPIANYLGMIVPARTKSGGQYSLDVTTALQDSVENSVCGSMFGIRLHFGNEMNALHIDDNLRMEYAFQKANARLQITLAPLYKSGGQFVAEAIETRELQAFLSWCSDSRYRILVEFSSNSVLAGNKPVSVELCFPALLQALGIDDRVDRNSIDVVEYDANTLTPKIFDDQLTDNSKYYIPSRIFYPAHTYSQIAYDVVAWKLNSDKSRLFAIYFDTMKNGPKPPRQNYPIIGAGEPFMCYSGDVALPMYGLFTMGDLDGDTFPDIISGGYTENGYLVFLKNFGPRTTPLFAEPQRISIGSKCISNLFFVDYGVEISEGMSDPAIWNWDSDGDIDLYVRFNSWYTTEQTYYQNTGNTQSFKFGAVSSGPSLPIDRASLPCYADLENSGIYWQISASLTTVYYRGVTIANFDKLVSRLYGFDIDGDGLRDIIIGLFDGTMAWCKNTGIVNGRARFAQPQILLTSVGPLKAGDFSTPYAVDWNGDGNLDLLSGTEDGHVIYFENTGTTAKPTFYNRGYVYADGQAIVFPGDPNEPSGQYWGYTSLSALDWNQNGVCDLMATQRSGYTNYYENVGSSANPDLRYRGKLRLVNGTYALPNPRVKPGFYDWNNDGKYDIIMGTTTGYAAIYYNAGEPNGLIFQIPIALRDPNGNTIYQERYSGQGRTRYAPIDWNNDGLMDLMLFNHAADDWPKYFENVGTITSPVFVEKAEPMVKDHHLWVGVAHEPCGMAVDWDNDGWQDIILGGEDGLVRYYNRQAFLNVPVIRRMSFLSRYGEKSVYDCRRFADIDRYVEKFTLYGDDLNRAQGSNMWQWQTGVAAHHGDLLVKNQPAGTEAVIYDPHLEGSYSIYLAFILQGSRPSQVQAKLSGDSSWQLLCTTLLSTYQVSPDMSDPTNYFQLLYWKDADLTGQKIQIQPVHDVNVQLDYVKFVPVSRVGVIAKNPFSISSPIQNGVSIYYDGNNYLRPADTIVPVGSYCARWGSRVYRGIYTFDLPAAIRSNYPGYHVKSAAMTLNLQYAYCQDKNLVPYDNYNMPGVRAYHVEIYDHNSNSFVVPNDFWAPVRNDLGYVIPSGGTLQQGHLYFNGTLAAGEYSLDITAALQDAVNHPEYGNEFAVRLHFGNEINGLVLDPNLYIEYVFQNNIPPTPVIEVQLVPAEILPFDCEDVKKFNYNFAADLNRDCVVNFADIILLTVQWLDACETSIWCSNCYFGENDIVDFRDFAILAGQWLLCNDPQKIGADPVCSTNW